MAGPPSIKARALRYLAQREHTRAELERKLARPQRSSAAAGAPMRAHEEADTAASLGAEIARALDELCARGLLSDARAAEALLASQSRRFGSRRLQHNLLAKGVPAELVRAAVLPVQASELERAQEVWRRRFGGSAPAAAPAERARQARFLAARGFDADVIRRIVNSGLED